MQQDPRPQTTKGHKRMLSQQVTPVQHAQKQFQRPNAQNSKPELGAHRPASHEHVGKATGLKQSKDLYSQKEISMFH